MDGIDTVVSIQCIGPGTESGPVSAIPFGDIGVSLYVGRAVGKSPCCIDIARRVCDHGPDRIIGIERIGAGAYFDPGLGLRAEADDDDRCERKEFFHALLFVQNVNRFCL